MPERTDALVESIKKYVECSYKLFVIDNGSDIIHPSDYTNVYFGKNIQTTNGWLEALKHATLYNNFFAYWFLITSAEYVEEKDILSPMLWYMREDEIVVGVHPALTEDSTTAWEHLRTRNKDLGLFRKTWMIDNIASLYRADWFDKIGRFDSNLKYAWGIDLETSYIARKQGKSLYVADHLTIKKVTNIGYTMDRMNMSAEDRERKARQNMEIVLSEKYGDDWWNILTKENTNGLL